MQNLQAASMEQQKNREAESDWVRTHYWGAESTEDAEDMGDTILGDVTHPTPIVMPQASSQWPLAIGLALASLFPTIVAGAFAVYLMTKDDAPAIQQPGFDDSSVSIGLGKIEDYIKEPAR